jgi:hypothetical protein
VTPAGVELQSVQQGEVRAQLFEAGALEENSADELAVSLLLVPGDVLKHENGVDCFELQLVALSFFCGHVARERIPLETSRDSAGEEIDREKKDPCRNLQR